MKFVVFMVVRIYVLIFRQTF